MNSGLILEIFLLVFINTVHSQRYLVVRAGTNVTLDCHDWRADSPDDVTWLCYGCTDDVIVSANQRPETPLLHHLRGISSVLHKFGRISLVPERMALKYDPVKVGDSGRYSCLVGKNSSNRIIELVVQDVAAAPGRPLVTKLGSRKVNLSWAPSLVTNNSPISHYIVSVRVEVPAEEPSGKPKWRTLKPVMTSSNITSTSVLDLHPYSLYKFRVTAVNGAGRSHPSVESLPTVTLAEKPRIAPEIVSVQTSGPSSITLSWRLLAPGELCGPFQRYRILYREVNSHHLHEVTLSDLYAQTVTLVNLSAFKNYTIAIQVQNSVGFGPMNNVTASTSAGVPDAPDDVTAVRVTSSSILLRWQRPLSVNGRMSGYRVFYSSGNITRAETLRNLSDTNEFLLTDLAANTTYSIKVITFTRTAEGEASTPLHVTTDTKIRPSPLISAVNCNNNNTIQVQWKSASFALGQTASPDEKKTGYDNEDQTEGDESVMGSDEADAAEQSREWRYSFTRYYITYRELEPFSSWKSVLINETGVKHKQVYLENMVLSNLYEFYMTASTRSVLNPSVWRDATPSPIVQTTAPYPDCTLTESVSSFNQSELPPPPPPSQHVIPLQETTPTSMTSLVSLSLTATALGTAAIVALTVWRWVAASRHLPSSSHSSPASSHQQMMTTLSGQPESWETECPRHGYHLHEVTGQQLHQQLTELLQHSATDLALQFEEIQSFSERLTLSCSLSRRRNQEDGTRCSGLAYNHSLVPIRSHLGSSVRQEYLNASYIDGFRVRRQYIATIAPPTENLATFWRMVWQNRVHVIVQLSPTDNVYKSWSREKAKCYDQIHVELVDESKFAYFSINKLLLRSSMNDWRLSSQNLNSRKSSRSSAHHRYIQHLHFTGWSSSGIGDDSYLLLKFVQMVRAIYSEHPDCPVLVYCCCGMDRTGCFIVLDSLLHMLKSLGTVNVYGCVRQGRCQRRGLVGTPEHYRLIHAALHHCFTVGNTEISFRELEDIGGATNIFSEKISGIDEATYRLQNQFEIATSYVPCEEDRTMCSSAAVRGLCRSSWPMTVESWRVTLPPPSTILSLSPELGDAWIESYINASYMLGYRSMKEFIIAEHPHQGTMADFWLMVHSQDSASIIVLSQTGTLEFPAFWPTVCGDVATFGSLTVQRVDSCSTNDHVNVQVLITVETERAARHVSLLLLQNVSCWSQRCHLADKLRTIGEAQRHRGRPLIVVDEAGGADAAKLCCVLSAKEQIIKEGVTDLFFYTKLYHEHRPGVWRHLDDYLDLFSILYNVLSNTGELSHFISREDYTE